MPQEPSRAELKNFSVLDQLAESLRPNHAHGYMFMPPRVMHINEMSQIQGIINAWGQFKRKLELKLFNTQPNHQFIQSFNIVKIKHRKRSSTWKSSVNANWYRQAYYLFTWNFSLISSSTVIEGFCQSIKRFDCQHSQTTIQVMVVNYSLMDTNLQQLFYYNICIAFNFVNHQ